MSKNVAILFPGQGSQAVGMGRELAATSSAARAVFEEADDALGESLSKIIWDGPAEDLKRTQITQPAILTMSIACMRAIEAELPGLQGKQEEQQGGQPNALPLAVAGHSLGEYSALVATGALKFSEAVVAVRARGKFMQEAVPQGEGAMAAVIGLGAEDIAKVCAVVSADDDKNFVAVANLNGPAQTVIAGTAGGVEAAMPALKEAGARRVMALPVSAPFHCKLMAPVQPRLDAVLAELAFEKPRVDVVSNVDAQPNSDAQRIRSLLVDQVIAPVRFTEIIEKLLELGATTFVEVGPGKALIGMVKRMSKESTLLNVDGPAGVVVAANVLAKRSA